MPYLRIKFLCGLIVLMACSVRAATLRGVVIDATGPGIPHASVQLFSGDHEWQATTDSMGAFAFSDLAAGTYDLEAYAFNFDRRSIENITIGNQDPNLLKVKLDVGTVGQCRDSSSISLPYEATSDKPSLGGLIYVVTGAADFAPESPPDPRPAATLFLLTADTETPVATIQMQKLGRYRFPNLNPGRYTLKVSLAGYGDRVYKDFRIRPGKNAILDVEIHKPGNITICE